MREVLPVLTKAGCNQGACHGASLGRGGFRLSLLGFDPVFDHSQIVQRAEGRRVVAGQPERSILLLKPSLAMEHGGGERFKVDAARYDMLKPLARRRRSGAGRERRTVDRARSLAAAAGHGAGRAAAVRRARRLERRPSDDVTATAQFDALNDAVATVTPAGMVTAKGRGEAHVMVRFAGQAPSCR